jgi:Zn-dependent peptidase ImmA (M78 family)
LNFIAKLAREHGVKITYESISSEDAFVMGRMIFLNPDLYPPRMNWRFCHELAHILLGHTKGGTINKEMEDEAETKAGELMLPPEEFNHLIDRHDLIELKERFPHASWEVIARRVAEISPAVLTIYDNKKLRSRSAPATLIYPRRLTTQEVTLAAKCFEMKSNLLDNQNGLEIAGFFVDEIETVKRVILITKVNRDEGAY